MSTTAATKAKAGALSPPVNQAQSISGGGTAELNYGHLQDTTVVGPQLTFDKNQLCMMTPVSVIAQDQVIVKNIGTTTVTYDWRRVIRSDFIQSKNSDGIQRFYCHYPHGILKPGESKTFTFSFRSAEKPGMYFEEWELITDPQLLQTLPMIYLSGISTLSDEQRQQTIQNQREAVDKQIKENVVKETLADVVDQVKEEGKPAFDMRESSTGFEALFKLNNRHLGLYYNQSLKDQLYDLLDDILFRAPHLNPDTFFGDWNGSIEYVENKISEVINPYSQKSFRERYLRILNQARKVPTAEAHSYSVLYRMLHDMSNNVIDYEQRTRDEMQVIANPGFMVPGEEATPEELKKVEDERKAKKADWYKTTKKKPKTDDEEAQEIEEIKSKTAQALKHDLLQNRCPKISRDIEIIRTQWLMDNHEKMNEKQFDDLLHLQSVLDIDIAGKDLLVRLDLDVPLSPYTPSTNQTEHLGMNSTDELHKSDHTKGSKSALGRKSGKTDSTLTTQNHPPKAEEPWKKRDILDHTLIKRAANELRYLQQERMANRAFVIGNLSDKSGRIKPENSMRILHQALSKQISEQPLVFLDNCVIPDFLVQKENEAFPEQTTFILENLNFKPDEFGFVEPEKPIEDPLAVAEEELKRQEEEKARELAASQQKGGSTGAKPPAPAKPAPVDKKKEEEAKKKAEEELAAKKKAEELASTSKSLTEEERLEIQRQKDEADRKKREAEYFDFKTTHKYKELLGRYGDIYVNDAPLATLTQSNSICEVKCAQKVMGVKMTEELRKCCQFFLKKHPKDIKDLWYEKPGRVAEYHQKEFAAVIGGSLNSVQDILDRILMTNGLMDSCKEIYLAGQFGLAALHALGVKVGHFEIASNVEQTENFFKELFLKSIEKGAKLHFPLDFQVAAQSDIDQAKQEQQEQDANLEQQQYISQQNQLSGKQGTTTKTQKGGLTQTGGDSQSIQQPGEVQSMDKPIRHWIDRLANSEGKIREAKIEHQFAVQWNTFLEKFAWQKYSEKGIIKKGQTETDPLLKAAMISISEPVVEEGDSEPVVHDEVKPNEHILELSLLSREPLLNMLNVNFKVFWDGSLSPLASSDSLFGTLSNKIFVERLQSVRVHSQNDDEPQVTLLHGQETEAVVRHSLLKIRVEQQEALEMIKHAAREARIAEAIANGEEEPNEEEEENQGDLTMTQGGDESFEGGHGGGQQSHDMHQLADFLCFDIPQFTSKVLSGVANRSLLGMSKHVRKPLERVAEDLYLLDEI